MVPWLLATSVPATSALSPLQGPPATAWTSPSGLSLNSGSRCEPPANEALLSSARATPRCHSSQSFARQQPQHTGSCSVSASAHRRPQRGEVRTPIQLGDRQSLPRHGTHAGPAATPGSPHGPVLFPAMATKSSPHPPNCSSTTSLSLAADVALLLPLAWLWASARCAGRAHALLFHPPSRWSLRSARGRACKVTPKQKLPLTVSATSSYCI